VHHPLQSKQGVMILIIDHHHRNRRLI